MTEDIEVVCSECDEPLEWILEDGVLRFFHINKEEN